MKRTIIIALALFLSKVGFSQVTSTLYDKLLSGLLDHSVDEISVKDASVLLDSVRFLDAREKEEFDVSHIKDAKWIGYDDFELERVELMSKEEPVIVYCSVGYRSEKIAEKLVEAGFQKVYNMYGGVFEWKNQGHAVVDANRKETEKVHAFSRTWGIWLDKGEKVY